MRCIKSLPPCLQYLQFHLSYNHPIGHLSLPSSVKELHFDQKWNQPIENWSRLPEMGLTTLTLQHEFNHPLPHLPATLTKLHLSDQYHRGSYALLPESLIELQCGNVWTPSEDASHTVALQFPPNLVCRLLNFPAISDFDLTQLRLPDSIEKISFSRQFRTPIYQFPFPFKLLRADMTRIVNFDDGTSFVTPRFPPTLKELIWGKWFDRSLQRLHLPSLISLRFGLFWKQPLQCLPVTPQLRRLELGGFFNQSINPIVHRLPSDTRSTHFSRQLQPTAK